ncbi:MAG: acetate/propionate family kinase [Maricaulaceae bacterium]
MSAPAAVIVALNAGSSSVKFSAFEADADGVSDHALIKGQVSGIGDRPALELTDAHGAHTETDLSADGADHATAFNHGLDALQAAIGARRVLAVGHRVVHGGREFAGPTLIDPSAMARMAALSPLAPGHQPHNLSGVRLAQAHWPDAPHVACFDTAFHRTQPRIRQLFALPRSFAEDGVLRYGFHGLSYDYIAHAAPEIIGEAGRGRLVVAHLGAGASLCAIQAGESVASTMGFTALDGLPMATRCGAIDAGVLLYLMERKAMGAADLNRLLYKQSGLKGLSGISGDMRDLLASDAPEAEDAVALFVDRVARGIADMAACLGGIDVLVFTAGIGEHAAPIRARVVEACAWMGFALDAQANTAHGPQISHSDHPSAWVIPTQEDWVVAQAAREAVRN